MHSATQLLEGIMVLAEETLRQRMDIKLFVDTDADVRILRRLSRDLQERGRPREVRRLVVPGEPTDVAVANKMAFVTAGGDLHVIDVSTPALPMLLATLDVPFGASRVVAAATTQAEHR